MLGKKFSEIYNLNSSNSVDRAGGYLNSIQQKCSDQDVCREYSLDSLEELSLVVRQKQHYVQTCHQQKLKTSMKRNELTYKSLLAKTKFNTFKVNDKIQTLKNHYILSVYY